MRVITRKRAGSGGRLAYAGRASVRKAQPSPSQVHVNVPLTNMSVAYMLNPKLFIASKAFAHVPVMQQSNVYYKFQKDDFLRDEARVRAPGTESAGGGFNLTTDVYGCVPIAYHKDIDDQARTNSDSQIRLDRVGTNIVTQKMLIRKEKQWVQKFFTTGIWATDVVGVASGATAGQFNQWDSATGDPQADVLLGRITILQSTGLDPRSLVIGPFVYKALQLNAKIQQRFQYTTAESITLEMLAGYLDMDEVLVANGVEATNKEGLAITTAFIAGKNALLCYKTDTPDLMMATAGYVMTWNAYAGSQEGATITKFRMQSLRSDRIEGEFAYDMKVVANDCGYFFSACCL